jgi:hypothetical protein
MIDKRKRKFLLIECDAPKLKAQGLSFSEALVRAASCILQDRLIHLIQTKEKELIPTQFAEAKQKSSNYSVIAIIGHSDSKGIRLGQNTPYRWEAFSNWPKPFRPQKFFLMSCQGGKTEVCSILFKNLPSLKEVYGSPVFLSQPEAMTIAGVALADLLDAETSTEMFPVAQIISILHKGFIWKMTRGGKEFAIAKEFSENIIMGLQKAIKNR